MTWHAPIWCCVCNKTVQARLTTGKEIYPKHDFLHDRWNWTCDGCGGYVGAHNKPEMVTRPLGCIPTPELRNWRTKFHLSISHLNRDDVYRYLSAQLGCDFHAGEVRSMLFAAKVNYYVEQYKLIQEFMS